MTSGTLVCVGDARAFTAALEDPPRHPTVVPLTESEGSITFAASSVTQSVPGNQDFESQEAQHVEEVQLGRVLQETLRSLDGVDVGHLFSMRAVLMKCPTCVRERSMPSWCALV